MDDSFWQQVMEHEEQQWEEYQNLLKHDEGYSEWLETMNGGGVMTITNNQQEEVI